MKSALSFLGLAALLFLSFVVGRISHKNRPLVEFVEKVDTLIVRDTVTVREPVYLTRWKTDSVLVPVADTVTVRDTLFVALERERVEWRDSLSAVYASGVRVSVDSVTHYLRERVVVKEVRVPVKERNRWGVGLQAGATVTPEGVRPYLGAGVSWNVWSW